VRSLRIPDTLEEGVRHFYYEDQPDIAWLRRRRRCTACGTEFLTAEISEALLDELRRLRSKEARSHASGSRHQVRAVRARYRWLEGTGDDVPYELARQLVEKSAWWLTHSSGNPVRAPRHADRLELFRCGWCVAFGANSFAASRVLARAREYAVAAYNLAEEGKLPPESEMKERLQAIPPTCVIAAWGEFYEHYPVNTAGELVFGAQAIDVNDCVKVLMRVTGLNDLLAAWRKAEPDE
jgi:ribosomal protein S27AE